MVDYMAVAENEPLHSVRTKLIRVCIFFFLGSFFLLLANILIECVCCRKCCSRADRRHRAKKTCAWTSLNNHDPHHTISIYYIRLIPLLHLFFSIGLSYGIFSYQLHVLILVFARRFVLCLRRLMQLRP